MKDNNTKQSSPPVSVRMVEDEAAEKIKKRLRDMGLIVNARVGKAPKQSAMKGEGK